MMFDKVTPPSCYLEIRIGDTHWYVLGRFPTKKLATLALGRLRKEVDLNGVEVRIYNDREYHLPEWDEDDLKTIKHELMAARKWKEEKSNDQPVQG